MQARSLHCKADSLLPEQLTIWCGSSSRRRPYQLVKTLLPGSSCCNGLLRWAISCLRLLLLAPPASQGVLPACPCTKASDISRLLTLQLRYAV